MPGGSQVCSMEVQIVSGHRGACWLRSEGLIGGVRRGKTTQGMHRIALGCLTDRQMA